ncbi:MAG: thioesterase family protein [Pseudomonadota bacterium]
MTETTMQRAEPPSRHAFRHFETIETGWADNDMYGHVNNAAYYRFFDTAVNRFLIEADVLEPETSSVIGLVVETGCRFFAPVSFPDRLDLGIAVSRLGNSSIRYELAVFKQGQEIAAAAGFFIHVYVDAATHRPVPVPDDMRAVIREQLMIPAAS